MLIYRRLYFSQYKKNKVGNNKVFNGKESQKLKMRHVRFEDEIMKDEIYSSLMKKPGLITRFYDQVL